MSDRTSRTGYFATLYFMLLSGIDGPIQSVEVVKW